MRAETIAEVERWSIRRPEKADIAIDDGRISEIAPELPAASARSTRAASTCFLACSTCTSISTSRPCALGRRGNWQSRARRRRRDDFFDMRQLNAVHHLRKEVDRKRVASKPPRSPISGYGAASSQIRAEMPEMAAKGVVGFKAFMCDSGLPEFPHADEKTLWDGMAAAALLGLPVAVHAEDDAMIRGSSAAMAGTTAREFLASRPVAAEVAAIAKAVEIAEKTGATLHIVHVSSGIGVAVAVGARCSAWCLGDMPAYLFLHEDDVERIGVSANVSSFGEGTSRAVCGVHC